MAVKLNKRSLDYAAPLIKEGRVVKDQREAWSEHQPSAEKEDEFIREHGLGAYGNWHLGIDDEEPEDAKARYKFPYGDFRIVHRCAVLTAESRAKDYKYEDIENAAAHLHGMIDAVKEHA